MDGPLFLFAGGGTGGHLYPGLAVAEAVCRIEPRARITFLTTDRPLDRDLLSRTPHSQIPQSVRPVSARPWHWPKFWREWSRCVAAAKDLMRKELPKAVLGLGGYAAGPAVFAARSLGLRSAILNPDAIPGRANRYLGSRTDLVILQWAVSRSQFPASTPCGVLGCPIRREFADAARGLDVASRVEGGCEANSGAAVSHDRAMVADPEISVPPDQAAARRRFDLAPDRPVLLVTGASQGARTVNQAVQGVWPEFSRKHPEWQLLHLTGPTDAEMARAAYSRVGATGAAPDVRGRVGATGAVRVEAFVHDMWLAIAAADLVVSRAGASTLAELTALGKPSILMPYPYHRDRHQNANAKVLVDAEAAILIDDAKDAAVNALLLLAALERAAVPAAREKMAMRARGLGLPRAADSVARWLLELSS